MENFKGPGGCVKYLGLLFLTMTVISVFSACMHALSLLIDEKQFSLAGFIPAALVIAFMVWGIVTVKRESYDESIIPADPDERLTLYKKQKILFSKATRLSLAGAPGVLAGLFQLIGIMDEGISAGKTASLGICLLLCFFAVFCDKKAKQADGIVKTLESSFYSKVTQGPVKKAEEISRPPLTDDSAEFKSLMTSQLTALWLDGKGEKYKDEFMRRMKMCRITDEAAEKWLEFEEEILERCPRPEMLSPDFVRQPLLTLRSRFLPREIAYYESHFDYPLSYVIRLSDEAEWHFWNSHEEDLPEGVWEEITALSDRNRELFLPMAVYMVEHLGWTPEDVNRYSMNEQGMLDYLRWDRVTTSGAEKPWGLSVRE